METLVKIINNLFKVRSIATLILVICASYGFLYGKITSEAYVPLVTLALTSLYKKNEVSEKQEKEE